MKTILTLMAALAALLVSGCGLNDRECKSQQARILVTAAALDQCASTARCIVTSESVVALYESVMHFQRSCPAPTRELIEPFVQPAEAPRGEPM